MSNENQPTMLRDLTQGSIFKNIFIYAWPLLVANSLQAIYNIVDMIVVGQVEGQIGLAAISIGTDILHLLLSLIMGFTSAGQVLIAQYVGAGEMDKVKKIIGSLYTSMFIVAIVLSSVCYFGGDGLLKLMNTPEAAYDEAKIYLFTCAVGGMVFSAGYNTTCAILRGMGNSKQPCIFIAIAAILNMVLDVWFVKYLKMGAFGAALATVIGQGVSFITAIIYLYKHKEMLGFDFKLKSFAISSDVFKPLIKLGVPMAIQGAAISISKFILAAWINDCGVLYTALAGIYNKLNMMINILANSLTVAGSTIVGQNIGAEKYDRVRKTILMVMLSAGVIVTVLGLGIYMFPDALFRLFTHDAEVIEASSVLIMPIMISFLGVIGRSYAFSLINGSGNSKLNLLVAIVDGIVARTAFAYIFGFVLNMSAKGFWMGDGLAGNIPFFIGLAFFWSNKWKARSH